MGGSPPAAIRRAFATLSQIAIRPQRKACLSYLNNNPGLAVRSPAAPRPPSHWVVSGLSSVVTGASLFQENVEYTENASFQAERNCLMASMELIRRAGV